MGPAIPPRTKCPVCGDSLKPENLARHLAAVHPGRQGSATAREVERASSATRKKPTRGRGPRIPRRLLAAALMTLAVVSGAWIVTTYLPGPPVDDTPALDMCVTHFGVQSLRATLNITVNGRRVYIPANVGISVNCMRPVHTHDDSGTLSIEGPPGRRFVLGDFFQVWGQPFSNTRIFDVEVNATHELVMTVDGVPSTEFGDLVLTDGADIRIAYRPR